MWIDEINKSKVSNSKFHQILKTLNLNYKLSNISEKLMKFSNQTWSDYRLYTGDNFSNILCIPCRLVNSSRVLFILLKLPVTTTKSVQLFCSQNVLKKHYQQLSRNFIYNSFDLKNPIENQESPGNRTKARLKYIFQKYSCLNCLLTNQLIYSINVTPSDIYKNCLSMWETFDDAMTLSFSNMHRLEGIKCMFLSLEGRTKIF